MIRNGFLLLSIKKEIDLLTMKKTYLMIKMFVLSTRILLLPVIRRLLVRQELQYPNR